ncbi:MAG: hypothetical protein CMJ40_09770 [Phycisphaerae bacterium]|nr:hypothetical protein [Phycisphaerae bacterium]
MQIAEIEDTQAVQLWWSGGFQCANNYWYSNPPMMQGGFCTLNTIDYTYSGKKISLWRFNLSTIPEAASVISLKIRLEGSATWGQQGNLFKLGMKTGTGALTIQDGEALYNQGEIFAQPAPSESMEYELDTNHIIEAQGTTDWLVVSMSAEYSSSTAYLDTNAALIVGYDLETCEGDFNQNGEVDVDDLLALINAYGNLDNQYDLDGNSLINVNDVLLLLTAYGECQ